MHRELPGWALAGARLIVRWSAGWRPYAIAIAAIAISTVIRGALQPWIGDRLFFTTYFPAIGIVAALCGLYPGLLALAGSAGLTWFLFLPPQFSFDLEKLGAIQLIVFMAAASPMLAIAAMLNVLVHWLLRQQQVIVEAKEAEARRYETLVRELEHRLRNLFALVQRVAIRTLQGDRDEARARDTFIDRMSALAAASGAGLGGSPTVDRLLRRQVSPYDAQVEIAACDPVELDLTHAQELSLIFHELATNAAKYGALSVPGGKVSVTCRVEDGNGTKPMFSLEWLESGGPAAAAPVHTGFGLELLKNGPAYAGAEVRLDYRPAGLRYLYRKPLARLMPRDSVGP